MEKTERYFIAYALEGNDRTVVDRLRQEIADRFGVTAALKFPPHMTIFHPFESDNISLLEGKLAEIVSRQKPFTVSITGFAAFEERVWFLDPVQDAALFSIKDQVRGAVKSTVGIDEDDKGHETHFHVTLAYKDVAPETHQAIGKFLKGENLPVRELTINNIAVLVWDENGEHWNIERVFVFGLKGE